MDLNGLRLMMKGKKKGLKGKFGFQARVIGYTDVTLFPCYYRFLCILHYSLWTFRSLP